MTGDCERPRAGALGLEGAAVAEVGANDLKPRRGRRSSISADASPGHIPGAWFATRARLPDALAKLPAAGTIVLTSPDGRLARLAAAELAGIASVRVVSLTGGTEAWVAAGLPLEQGATHLADAADDVVLSARERNQDREAAMREYLEWEINLVNDMATDDDHRFQVAAG
jgi:rhodanese-related sulfurtransferase